jgi:hypothetical protein
MVSVRLNLAELARCFDEEDRQSRIPEDSVDDYILIGKKYWTDPGFARGKQYAARIARTNPLRGLQACRFRQYTVRVVCSSVRRPADWLPGCTFHSSARDLGAGGKGV